MTDDAPLPGLDPDEPAAGRPVPCDMCGRSLTGATARRRRLGDDCWRKMHPGLIVRMPGRFEVEQDGLFSP